MGEDISTAKNHSGMPVCHTPPPTYLSLEEEEELCSLALIHYGLNGKRKIRRYHTKNMRGVHWSATEINAPALLEYVDLQQEDLVDLQEVEARAPIKSSLIQYATHHREEEPLLE